MIDTQADSFIQIKSLNQMKLLPNYNILRLEQLYLPKGQLTFTFKYSITFNIFFLVIIYYGIDLIHS